MIRRLLGGCLFASLAVAPAHAWDIKTTAIMTNKSNVPLTAKMHNEMTRVLQKNEVLDHSSYFTSSGNEERVYDLWMTSNTNNNNWCRAVVYIKWAFSEVSCRFDGPSGNGPVVCSGYATYDAGSKTCRAEFDMWGG